LFVLLAVARAVTLALAALLPTRQRPALKDLGPALWEVGGKADEECQHSRVEAAGTERVAAEVHELTVREAFDACQSSAIKPWSWRASTPKSILHFQTSLSNRTMGKDDAVRQQTPSGLRPGQRYRTLRLASHMLGRSCSPLTQDISRWNRLCWRSVRNLACRNWLTVSE